MPSSALVGCARPVGSGDLPNRRDGSVGLRQSPWPAFAVQNHGDDLAAPDPPTLSHGICERCLEQFTAALDLADSDVTMVRPDVSISL